MHQNAGLRKESRVCVPVAGSNASFGWETQEIAYTENTQTKLLAVLMSSVAIPHHSAKPYRMWHVQARKCRPVVSDMQGSTVPNKQGV